MPRFHLAPPFRLQVDVELPDGGGRQTYTVTPSPAVTVEFEALYDVSWRAILSDDAASTRWALWLAWAQLRAEGVYLEAIPDFKTWTATVSGVRLLIDDEDEGDGPPEG